jgi:hypothetical protein
MDRDEKIKMLLDMQDHPEQYSDEALEQMLNDAEAQELMEATAQLKRAIINDEFTISEQDVEDEWKEFASKHFARQKPQYNWLKMAAMFIGILFITGLAFASIHMIRHNSDIQEPQPKEQTVRQQAVLADNVQSDTTILAEPVVFENVSLDSIAKGIAAWYHMDMDLQNEQACELRFHFIWKPNDSLQEVIEKLNMFEHVDMAIEDGKLIVR